MSTLGYNALTGPLGLTETLPPIPDRCRDDVRIRLPEIRFAPGLGALPAAAERPGPSCLVHFGEGWIASLSPLACSWEATRRERHGRAGR